MGNAESAPRPKGRRSTNKVSTRKSLAEQSHIKGQGQDYSNRYSSRFNRTQFLSHSASDMSSDSPEITVFSCLTDDGGAEGGGVSCLTLQPGSGGTVSTLYDVEANAGRQIVWEYQRFLPGLGWGAANFEDPGDLPLSAATNVRFATVDHERFGDSMAAVAPEIPPGWAVDLTWSIVVQRRIRKRAGRGGGDVDETGMSDRFGWHYGRHIRDDKW